MVSGGGVVSGGITLASMLPMGNRLLDSLDKAHFDYDSEDMEEDMNVIVSVCEEFAQDEADENSDESSAAELPEPKNDVINQIKQAKQLLEDGVISEEEFAEIKAKLIAQL